MTEVNFYKLVRSSAEGVLPRLLEKIIKDSLRATILFQNNEKLEEFDEILWTYESRSFIPHTKFTDKNLFHQPIILSMNEKNLNNSDILITIDGSSPSSLDNFEKYMDIFDGNFEDQYKLAITRIENLINKGYKVNCWTQNNSGWEKVNSFS